MLADKQFEGAINKHVIDDINDLDSYHRKTTSCQSPPDDESEGLLGIPLWRARSFDLQTGNTLALNDAFAATPEFFHTIFLILKENRDWAMSSLFNDTNPEESFVARVDDTSRALTRNGLRIHLVIGGAQGELDSTIPYSRIAAYVRPEGPLGTRRLP